jgi:CheY-like chemotaxis protein
MPKMIRGEEEMYKRRILIVEDEDMIADLEKQILEKEGFEVDVVSDGVEGLRRIKQNGYDVIISDSGMPRMKGDEFYLEVKRLNQDLAKRMIFVSGSINDLIESTGKRFLMKPISNRELAQVVRDFIALIDTQSKTVKIDLMDFIRRAREVDIGKALIEFSSRLCKIEIIEEKVGLIKAYISTTEGGENPVTISEEKASCSCRESFQYGFICKHIAVLIFHLIDLKYSENN